MFIENMFHLFFPPPFQDISKKRFILIWMESNTTPMSLLINEPKHCSRRWFICRIIYQDNQLTGVNIIHYAGLAAGIKKRWDIIWPSTVKHSQSRYYVLKKCGETFSCNVCLWLPRGFMNSQIAAMTLSLRTTDLVTALETWKHNGVLAGLRSRELSLFT